MSVPSVGLRNPHRSAESFLAQATSAFGKRLVEVVLNFAPLLIIFLGYALRVWRLSAFSITYDELDSILFGTMPLGQLFTALATYEPHPPFYYLFLHGWLAVAGQSELALRLPSALFGTLGVASAYSAGRVIGGRPAGWAAAAILAVSQFSVLYSQDARMYAALQAWIALYLAGLLHYLQRPTRLNATIVALAGLLAACTHYHGLLAVVFGVVPILLTVPFRQLPSRLRPFVVILVLYAPWIVFARHIFLTYRGWMAVVPPLEILRRSVVAYSVGVGLTGTASTFALAVIPAFATVGVAALVTRRLWRWLVVLLSLGLAPLLAVMIGAATGRPLFDERYLIVVTPAYLTLAGVGLAFASRPLLARPVALAAIVGLGVVSLPSYYWPATPPNPDFRGTAAYIEKAAGPAAFVVLPHPQGESIPYYLQDRLPTYIAPDRPPPDAVAAELASRLAGRREAWFVRYATDPGDEAIGLWLEANAFYIGDQWITQNHVLTYALAPAADLSDRSISARLADGVAILAVRIGSGPIRPGGRVLVGFRWLAPAAGVKSIPPNTKVSVRLSDPWGQTVASLDRLLVNPAGLVLLDPVPIWQGAMPVPVDAVPGRYRAEARFYNAANGQAIAVAEASGPLRMALDFGAVTIQPADGSAVNPATLVAGSAIALGPGLFAQQIGLAGGPYTQYSHLVANFVWASQTNQVGPIVPELGVRDAAGQIAASAQRIEADQPYPLRQLRAGERVREHLDLALRAVSQSGTYQVVLRASPSQPWAAIGSIDVAIAPTSNQTVPLTQTRSDLFDGVIRLVGANVPTGPVRAGSSFTVSLGWHAEGHPTAQYTVFIHLVKGSGQPLAQSDAIPGGAGRPTTDWIPGDYVLDQHQIAVPPTLPPGQYNLIAGLYEADTGRRADVIGSSTDGQTVDLGVISVIPP